MSLPLIPELVPISRSTPSPNPFYTTTIPNDIDNQAFKETGLQGSIQEPVTETKTQGSLASTDTSSSSTPADTSCLSTSSATISTSSDTSSPSSSTGTSSPVRETREPLAETQERTTRVLESREPLERMGNWKGRGALPREPRLHHPDGTVNIRSRHIRNGVILDAVETQRGSGYGYRADAQGGQGQQIGGGIGVENHHSLWEYVVAPRRRRDFRRKRTGRKY